MKKNLLGIMAIVMMVTSTMMMSSCGDKNDSSDSKDTYEKATVRLAHEYSADWLKYYNTVITVTDFNGKTQTVDLTKNTTDLFETTAKNGSMTITYSVKRSSTALASTGDVTLRKILIITGATTDLYEGVDFENKMFGLNAEMIVESPVTETKLNDVISSYETSGKATITLVDGELRYSEN